LIGWIDQGMPESKARFRDGPLQRFDPAGEPDAGPGSTSSASLPERDKGIFDGIAVGVIIANSDGDLVEWNPAALKLHGFKTVEEVRRHLSSFTRDFVLSPVEGGPPIPLDQWPVSKALRREPVVDYELRVRRVDTSQEWVVSYDAAWIHVQLAGRSTEQIILTMRDMTARHQVQAERDQSERQFRELTELLPQLVWTCHGDGKCDYLSPQWVAYTGIPAEQHLDFRWAETIHPEDKDQTLRAWKVAAAEGHILDIEFRIRRHDGAYRWFKTRAVPLRDPGGNISRWFGTNTDIHDQRLAGDALRASETRFRTLANAMPQIIWASTPDGQTSYRNRQWTEFTGLESTAGQPDVRRVVHPDDYGPLREAWDEARRTITPYAAEFRMRHQSGGPYRWFLARGVPVTGNNGQVIEWFGTNTDIHDLKQTQELARENEARLRGVLESAVEGIVTIDERGIVESVNSSVGKTFGYATQELIGRNVRMLMPSPYATSHDQYLRNYLSTGERKIIGIGREVVGRRKDGSTFPIDLSVSEVYVGGRRIFTGIIRDITTRRAAEDRAQERQVELAHLGRVRTMSQMASGLAHELNQPLGAIANYARASRSMVESARGEPVKIAAALAEIQSEALRAGAIINRLRGFVKKNQPSSRRADVNELISDAIRLMSFELRNVGVEPELNFAKDLPPVFVDHIQIGQVLINLIRNALDAMQSAPISARHLTMMTSRGNDGLVEIAVCDKGCGVPPESLPHIFEAFFTTKPSGLGLGLGLCRTIVEDYGGRLIAETNSTGGMTFRFTLPPTS
jgi:two-component system sensor kinase FixL